MRPQPVGQCQCHWVFTFSGDLGILFVVILFLFVLRAVSGSLLEAALLFSYLIVKGCGGVSLGPGDEVRVPANDAGAHPDEFWSTAWRGSAPGF
jgi:hypothetical protein